MSKKSKDMFVRVSNLSKLISKYNNAYLAKYHRFTDKHHRMLTYLVDEKLYPLANQPKFVMDGSVYSLQGAGQIEQEWMFVQTCQKGSWLPKRINFHNYLCRYLHHNNPYLKLGPFLEEQFSLTPYFVVFHDLMSNREIEYLIQVSKPNLTRKRTFASTSGALNQYELKSGKARRFIDKTVQTWISEVKWPNLTRVENWVGKKFTRMIHPILWNLNQRIGLATQLVTDVHGSATKMQVTNYGLGGLCEKHIDPVGIMELEEENVRVNQPQLFVHGDIFATVMAWLSDTKAGGGTVYLSPGYEGIVLPERGAAAFWYDLKSDGTRDRLTVHAGCPVLKGSKWILNKWIHMYDNFNAFPCKLQMNKRFDEPSWRHYH